MSQAVRCCAHPTLQCPLNPDSLPCSMDGVINARLHVKGAAEIVLQRCTSQLQKDGSVAELTDQQKHNMLETFGQDGNRCVP